MKKLLLAIGLLTTPLWADTGIIPISANFNVGSGVPLDSRQTVSDTTARNAIPGNQRYLGLAVFQRSDNSTWQLQGDTNTWVNVTGGGGGGSVIAAPQFAVPYYGTPGTSSSVQGAASVTTDGAGALTMSSSTVTTDAEFGNSSSVSGPAGGGFHGYYSAVRSSGTTGGLLIDSRGVPGGGGQTQTGAVTIRDDAQAGGPASTLLVLVDSRTSAQTGTAILDIYSLANTHNDPLIWIHRNSSNSSPEMRWDSPSPNFEMVDTSSDNTHGRGKWEPYASPYQSEILQVNSRAWDNTTFENVAYWEPLSIQSSIGYPGLYIRAQDLTDDSGVLTSSQTAGIQFFTLNNHTVGLQGPSNSTASWDFMLPNTFTNGGQVMYQSTSVKPWNWAFTSGGTSGQFLQFTSTSTAPVWATTSGGSSVATSSGIAFGGPSNTVIVDTNSFTWNPSNKQETVSGILTTQYIANQTAGGTTKEGFSFASGGSVLGNLTHWNYSTLCSDLSTVCVSIPYVLDFSGSDKYVFNSDGRFSNAGTGTGFGANAYSSTILGSMIVGAGVSDTTNIGPNNLKVTAGIIASTMSLTSSGAGTIQLTQGVDSGVSSLAATSTLWASSTSGTLDFTNGIGSTYTVVGSTITASAGHCSYWTAAGTIGDTGAACGTGSGGSTPGGNNLDVQISSAGALGGFDNFTNNGTTVTISSVQKTVYTNTSGITLSSDTLTVDGNSGGINVKAPAGITATYGVSAGSMTGAGLSTCGDTSHALAWTGGQFSCQSITGSSAIVPSVIKVSNDLYGSVANSLNVSSQPVCETIDVPVSVTVSSITVQVTATGGSIDVGIYNTAGTRLGSSGSTTPGSLGRSSIALTAPTVLSGGTYWACVTANNTTITLGSLTWATNNPPGQQTCAQSSSNYPLPTTLTFPCSATRTVNYDLWVNPQNGVF